jgi:DUF1009 family protein
MNNRAEIARLGIIAGGGELPRQIVGERRSKGLFTSVVRIGGSTDDTLGSDSEVELGIGRIGHVVSHFKKDRCTSVCFAGYVKRPNLQTLNLDMKGVALLPRVLVAARQGDGALLAVMVTFMEENGFSVVAPEQQLSDAIPTAGPLGSVAVPVEAEADLEKASRIARIIGANDIGQGAIVCDGLVLAVEAQEGTDAMLARVTELPSHLRGTQEGRRGVLFKAPMSHQDRRIDLPTLGVETVLLAAKAGLAGIGIEAGGAILLNRNEMVSLADRMGLFLVAIDPADKNPDLSEHQP